MNELFNGHDWSSFIDSNRQSLGKEIDLINGDRLLNTSEDDLVKYFIEKYYFNVPIINEFEISVDQNEIDIDVSKDPTRSFFERNQAFYVKGTQITFYIPFIGEEIFFQVQPNRYSVKKIQGSINNNCIVYSISNTDHNPEQVKREFEQYLNEVKQYLQTQRNESTQYNLSLEASILGHITARKVKLLKDKDMVSNLGYKMKINPNSTITYGAPEIKRKKLQLPQASSNPFKNEPVLLNEDFENILTILENMTHVMERSPKAFKEINEESLRMHFLVQLNGHYEGNATGETFNFNGKTDIIIRSQDKNIFIGECKFWKGKSQYLDTLSQIISYSSWRDTKVAVLIFNRNKNMSQVIENIKDITKVHPNYKREKDSNGESKFRYIFSQKDDSNREMEIAVLIFDVPE